MNRSILLFGVILVLSSLPLVGVVYVAYAQGGLTDNEDFFTLSIAGTPDIDADSWNLTVDGLVDSPLNLSYDEVTTLPRTSLDATLKCVEGPSDRAAWAGVRVSEVLDLAGVREGAEEVVFHAADGYTSSLTLDDASEDDVLLAWEMNGETLPPDHGFPLRLVAPDKAGYKWVKWIVRMEVVDEDYKGYWERRGWDDDADLTTYSDWGPHAILLSVGFILGASSMVTGMKVSRRKLFADLPRWVNRRFHRVLSGAYLGVLFAVFFYWVYATIDLRGDVFYTPHGILGAVVLVMHTAGSVAGMERFIEKPGAKVLHRVLNRFGLVLYFSVIMLGLWMASGTAG